jgi:hypothetical protein
MAKVQTTPESTGNSKEAAIVQAVAFLLQQERVRSPDHLPEIQACEADLLEAFSEHL